ncbi:MFS transporter [Sphaerisporangium fuscum]|uniref:MFS transporter n=1 Tax=Sphaerisporangium fuscum TaxID=2835868 RepID=UPI001BDD8B4C|nr:MFS transporter [Sphaerisporangium fuscum]
MYLSESRRNDADKASGDGADGPPPPGGGGEAAGPRGPGGAGRIVVGNVLALGMVSFLTDISSEMITAVLPLYLVFHLGVSTIQFGLLDGLYTGATAVLRLVGGHVADRFQRRKAVAGAGYGLSAVTKLGFLAAGTNVPLIGLVIGVDRTGKGLRTAPRDAIISLSAPNDGQGRAFGFHRALDTAGALLGPLATFGVLWLTLDAYDSVFSVSFCVALAGVLVLALFVREPEMPSMPDKGGKERLTFGAAAGMLRVAPFRRVVIAVLPLSLMTISDAFLALLAQQRLDIAANWLPLVPVGISAAYLVAAMPFGRLADRYGPSRVMLGGYLAVLACYLLVIFGGGVAALVAALGLRGLGYAATDGVVSALAGPLVPKERRTMGLAIVQTGQALAAMAGAWCFGALWTLLGPRPALAAMATGLGLALVLAAVLLRGGSSPFSGRFARGAARGKETA